MQLPDFDTLKAMASDNPDALEALRQQHVDALIDSAPEAYQQRLRGLQFQIDAKRQVAKNPTQACMSISQMMHDSFAELRTLLNSVSNGADELKQSELQSTSLQQIGSAADALEETEAESAAVIPFPVA